MDARCAPRRFRQFVRRVRSLLDTDPRAPSIPLTVAAQAAGSVRVAAEMADSWNTFGGRGLSAAEGRDRVRQRLADLVRCCHELGRQPAEIKKSLLLGYGFIAEEPFRSVAAFNEVVEIWDEIGMDEIIFSYPPELVSPPGRAVDLDVFERIVRDVLPSLRAS